MDQTSITDPVGTTVKAQTFARALGNSLLAACSDFTLPAISSVRLTFTKTEVKLAATDRYRLLIETLPAECAAEWSTLLSVEDVKRLRQIIGLALKPLHSGMRRDMSVTLTTTDEGKIEARCGDLSLSMKPADFHFPDVDKLIKDNTDRVEAVETIQFNPKYLADLGRITPAVLGSYVHVQFGGNSKPAVATVGDTITYLLMPVKPAASAVDRAA